MTKTQTTTFQMTARLYSPRWGHDDNYRIRFEPNAMHIDNGASKSATCTFAKGSDPEWSGYRHPTGNPLMNIFSNDHIHAPDVIPMAMESAWERWRDGQVSEEQLKAGIDELFAWISETATNSPSSEFWTPVF